MLLILLEHRVMRGLRTLDHDIDDCMQARGAGERNAQLTLADDERPVRLAVQHAGDQSLAAQALGIAGAELVGSTLLDLQCDSVPRHGGEV